MKKGILVIPLAGVVAAFIALGAFKEYKWDWNASTSGKNINYCLLIGQTDHNDSQARTKGIREALDTRDKSVTPVNANTESPRTGHIKLAGEEYTVNELAGREQRSDAGSTWDKTTATNTISAWTALYGERITCIISNNDGMAEGALNASNLYKNTPIFGYDSNSSTLQLVNQGKIQGTINSNAPAQAGIINLLAAEIIKNPDVTIDHILTHVAHKEDGKPVEPIDGTFGKIEANFAWNKTNRSLLVDSFEITKNNVKDYLTSIEEQAIKTLKTDGSTNGKEIFVSYYDKNDTYINDSFEPLMNVYKDKLGFKYNVVKGNGNDEPEVLNSLVSKHDAFVINLTKNMNAEMYFKKLEGLYSGDLDKLHKTPIIFFNRQPTNENGQIDDDVINNIMNRQGYKHIYYVGFDAIQGGEMQGKMVFEWLESQAQEHKK